MDPLCTQVSMSVCTQTDRYRRGARVSLAIRSAKDIMCMDIRLRLDACTSERRRDTRVGVRLRRVRARARPRWGASASGYDHRSECIGVSITLVRVCVQCVATFCGFGPVRPHVRLWLRGGRGPHTRAVHGRSIDSTKVTALPEWLGQCKLLEELCVPPRRAAALRVRGGAGAALLRVALPCRGAGPHHAALDAAAAALPVVGRGRAPRGMAGTRGRPARVRGGPEPLGAAARLARRDAGNTELAALPAAAEWPSLKYL